MQIFSEREMIAFRVDGNNIVGMGHVMRCIAIAENIGCKVMFITCDDRANEVIVKNGFKCVKINGKYNELMNEIPVVEEIISKYNITKIVIDTYFATCEYVQKLSEKTKMIILGSSKNVYNTAKLLINYSCAYDEKFYKDNYNDTKLLLGAMYTPLKKDFNENECKIRNKVKRVVVTTGGTQKDEMCLGIISKLANYDCNILIDVIVSGNDERIKNIDDFAKTKKNIEVYKNINDMAVKLSNADILITAAGTTLYEACALGVPTITFALVNEQENDGTKVSYLSDLIYAGSVDSDGREIVISNIIKGYEILNDYEKRLEISGKMKKIVDGKGTEYIAKEIENI